MKSRTSNLSDWPMRIEDRHAHIEITLMAAAVLLVVLIGATARIH